MTDQIIVTRADGSRYPVSAGPPPELFINTPKAFQRIDPEIPFSIRDEIPTNYLPTATIHYFILTGKKIQSHWEVDYHCALESLDREFPGVMEE